MLGVVTKVAQRLISPFSLHRHGNTRNTMNQLPPRDHSHESRLAAGRCTHWINLPSREPSVSSLCSRSSSLACLLRMFSLSSSRHLAFSIISWRFRSSSSDESFLLNTETILSGLLLSQQKTKHYRENRNQVGPQVLHHPVLSMEMPNPGPHSAWVSFLPNYLGQVASSKFQTCSEGFHTLSQ